MTRVGKVAMDIDAICSELMNALDRATQLPPLTARVAGFDLAAAYAVGAELMRQRNARGERPIGRKLGFTNRAVWDVLGVDAPFWAPVYDTTVTFLGTTPGGVDIDHLAQPRLEPEIVLHFGTTPPAVAGEAELLAHVDWIALGYEIVQCHFPGWSVQTADAVADFGVHGALVVGPPVPVAVLSDPVAALRVFTITLAREGVEEARGGGTNVLGSPLRALADVVAASHDRPGWVPLSAGEIVTTGTLTALHSVHGRETWSVEASGINLARLDLRIN